MPTLWSPLAFGPELDEAFVGHLATSAAKNPLSSHCSPNRMHFQSDIVVERPLGDVSAFFDDPQNLVKWDKSVARMERTSIGEPAAGFTFDTISPKGLRMSYRITAHDPKRGSTIELMASKMFKRAIWIMRFDRLGTGTRITCEVDFTLRSSYFFLAPPLILTQRKALALDMISLKRAIEANE